MHSYKEFWDAVKARLKSNLAAFELSDGEIDKYMFDEKEQIDSEFRYYESGGRKDSELSPEAFFKACVNRTAYCLEMCY